MIKDTFAQERSEQTFFARVLIVDREQTYWFKQAWLVVYSTKIRSQFQKFREKTAPTYLINVDYLSQLSSFVFAAWFFF